mgnify:FL=1
MSILEKIEDGLEQLFEGIFQRNKGKLEPASLARSLIRTMQRAGRRGVENIYVPNLFQVQIADGEYRELAPLISALAEECQEVLSREASERGYSAVGPFRVELEPCGDLEPGKWKVIRAFANESGQTMEENTKRWSREALAPSLQLRVLEGPDRGKLAPWKGETLVIGRAVHCGLSLSDHNASREHAKIQQQDDDFYLSDLNSTNGTFLNSQKIERKKLNLGDLICIGETVISWEKG